MPSPFPGMDPYIEAPSIWPDFHVRMLVHVTERLNANLPPRYVATAEMHVWLQLDEDGSRALLGKPDVHVATDERHEFAGVVTVTNTLAAPISTTLPMVRQQGTRYIRIVDLEHRRVVTVIELLSPANKTCGADGIAYRTERTEYLATGVNLVEIDLLRAGVRPPLGDPLVESDYYILVCRADEYPNSGLWPLTVRNRLPEIPIPLDPQDAPIPLALRASMNHVYDTGRYATRIDYDRSPPPLSEPDAAWARDLLSKRSI